MSRLDTSPPIAISKQSESVERIATAEQMRRFTRAAKNAAAARSQRAQKMNARVLRKARTEFLRATFDEGALNELKWKIGAAAKMGDLETEALSFPASYCTDGGRAINNEEKDWPETLQGKARDFYAVWRAYGRARGYRLRAFIKDFPDGLPGAVSLIVSWR